MLYKTYREWLADGYQVVQGQKSVKKNDAGTPLFSDKQVSEIGKKRYREDHQEEYDDEAEHERDQIYGLDGWGH